MNLFLCSHFAEVGILHEFPSHFGAKRKANPIKSLNSFGLYILSFIG